MANYTSMRSYSPATGLRRLRTKTTIFELRFVPGIFEVTSQEVRAKSMNGRYKRKPASAGFSVCEIDAPAAERHLLSVIWWISMSETFLDGSCGTAI